MLPKLEDLKEMGVSIPYIHELKSIVKRLDNVDTQLTEEEIDIIISQAVNIRAFCNSQEYKNVMLELKSYADDLGRAKLMKTAMLVRNILDGTESMKDSILACIQREDVVAIIKDFKQLVYILATFSEIWVQQSKKFSSPTDDGARYTAVVEAHETNLKRAIQAYFDKYLDLLDDIV